MKVVSTGWARAAVAVSVGVLLASCALVSTADDRPAAAPSPSPSLSPSPSPRPSSGTSSGADVDGVPVWYDAKGLHRGDIVEQTPVPLGALGGQDISGALALVRSGALYLDPATGDVWFHPWGGVPRIVGQNSGSGPGGDPNGDIAAWFEGYGPLNAPPFEINGGPGELVVYDTAAGREISRTGQSTSLVRCTNMCAEHIPAGNTFLQVSAERVVWKLLEGSFSHDVRTQETSPIAASVIDVHGNTTVSIDYSGDRALAFHAPGRAKTRYPDLEARARVSPTGNHILSIEGAGNRHGAVIIDTGTGELWRISSGYSFIAWSYGDIALVDNGGLLKACDAARRECQTLTAERPFLMPTN